MHMLCDALQRSGYEAYISTDGVNPALMTPVLTDEVRARHSTQNVEPIVVYPEVVSGNPYAGNVVVRYLLNIPGFINGDGVFGDNDVLFAYTQGLRLPQMDDENVLFLPPIDLRVFRLPDTPAVRVPGKVCFYQGRKGTGPIDSALMSADAVQITSTYPSSWEELVSLFQSCEYFISTTTTALSAEAALCGCVGVVIPGPNAPVSFTSEETGNYGVAWGDAPEELARARRTLPLLRESLLQREVEFWPALDHFISVTQDAALEYITRRDKASVAYWLKQRVASATQERLIAQHLQERDVPVFGIVVLDPEGSTEKLVRTIHSLTRGHCKAVFKTLVLTTSEVAIANPNDHIFVLDESDHVGAINRAIATGTFDFFMIVQAGEEFTTGGLLSAVMDISSTSALRAVYADEVMRFEDGNLDFLLRPDINLDLLLSLPVGLARHWLFRHDVWCDMGGFSSFCPDAFELEFILRLIEVGGFQGLGHISEPLVIGDVLELKDNVQEREVIERYLCARGFDQPRVSYRASGHYDVDYGHAATPLVSIILLVAGQLERIQLCVESVLENTDYRNFEMLFVDHGNADPQSIEWLDGIDGLGVDHLRVLRFTHDVSVSHARNQAAQQAQGEFLLFLDPNCVVIRRDWLDQLLNHGMRGEVGAVGSKLIGADGLVQHAGLLLGGGAPVGNPFLGLAVDATGYMRRLQVDQNYTALSEKCLLVHRDLFVANAGFDEQMEPWQNIDLCIRLQQAGYLNVWAARAQLLIGDAGDPATTLEQEDKLYERWLPVLANDPASNLNFSATHAGVFSIVDPALSWRPLSTCKSLPVVLAQPAIPGSSAQHRIIRPFEVMRELGVIEGAVFPNLLSVVELERFSPDTILLQQQTSDSALQAMRRMKLFSGAFKVHDLEGCLTGGAFEPIYEHRLETLYRGLSYMDRLLAPNAAMAQLFEGVCADVRIIETRLDSRWSGLVSGREHACKPRVGWAGTANEVGELELIADVIKALANEVHWVVFGACPKQLRPFVHELHRAVSADAYPQKLASLNLDLALAPLEDTLFNRCKSDLRLLEYGACGYPVICSDIEGYRNKLPIKRVDNRYESWVEAIRTHTRELDAAAQLGDHLRTCIQRERVLDGIALAQLRDSWLER